MILIMCSLNMFLRVFSVSIFCHTCTLVFKLWCKKVAGNLLKTCLWLATVSYQLTC